MKIIIWRGTLNRTALVYLVVGDDTNRLLFKSLRSLLNIGSQWEILIYTSHPEITQEVCDNLNTSSFNNVIKIKPPICFNIKNVDQLITEFRHTINAL